VSGGGEEVAERVVRFGVGRLAPYSAEQQHASAYVGMRQQSSAYVSIRQHTSAYVSMRQPLQR
jgi:hypothetical protein